MASTSERMHTQTMMIVDQIVAKWTATPIRSGSILTPTLTQFGMAIVLVVAEAAEGNGIDDIPFVTLVNVLATVRVHCSVALLARTLVRAKGVDALLFTQIGVLHTLVHVDTLLAQAIGIAEPGFTLASVRAGRVQARRCLR